MIISLWDQNVMYETQNIHLIKVAERMRNQNNRGWIKLEPCLKKYVDTIFEEKTVKKEVFLKFFAIVCTRAFGSDLPSGTLVPMADNFNHANNNVGWGLCHRDL